MCLMAVFIFEQVPGAARFPLLVLHSASSLSEVRFQVASGVPEVSQENAVGLKAST